MSESIRRMQVDTQSQSPVRCRGTQAKGGRMTVETRTVEPLPGTPTSPVRAARVVAPLAFAGMTAAFTQTILIPIQGELPQLLNASNGDTAWVITITLLVAAICTPISGKL